MLRLLFLTLAVLSTPVAAEKMLPSQVPAEAFARLPYASDGKISPDGKYFAFFSPVDGRRVLVSRNLASGESVGVPFAGRMDFSWFHWASDDRIVFAAAYTGERHLTTTRETRLFSIDRDLEKLQRIVKPATVDATGSRLRKDTLPPPQIQDKVIDWLPDEPDYILVSLDEDHDGADEVRRINIHNGDYKIVHRDQRGIQNWMPDRQGVIRLGWGYDVDKFRLVLRQPDDSWVELDRTVWGKQGHRPIGFDRNPRYILAVGPGEKGLDVLLKIDLFGGRVVDTVYSHPMVDVHDLVNDPLTGRPIGVSFVEHEFRVHYFDETFAGLQKKLDATLPDTVNKITSMSRDRSKIIVFAASDVDPGLYYLWDRPGKEMSLIAEAMPGLTPDLLSRVQPVSYKARDGLRIHAYLTVPQGVAARNLPVVVMPHGGPHARTTRDYDFLRQFLASRGYAVMEPNFRGSDGYGAAFRDAGEKEWGGKMQDDVTDGVHWLVAQGIANPERVCIVGWSYGGYAAAMGAIKTPELYRCAASINGVLDLPNLVSFDKGFIGGRVWSKSVGLEGERLKAVSPYHRAKEIRVPLLLVHAKDDSRVPVRQAERMSKKLKKLKRDVTLVTIEHGGHSMGSEPARAAILTSLEQFLARTLGP